MACPHLQPVWTGLSDRVGSAQACRQPQCKAPRAELWLCVTPSCGYLSCGRRAKGHAEQHFANSRRDSAAAPHRLCMNVASGALYCYECNENVAEIDSAPNDYKVR